MKLQRVLPHLLLLVGLPIGGVAQVTPDEGADGDGMAWLAEDVGLSAAGSARPLPVPYPLAPVRRDLPFFYDLYTFRGSEGGTTVVAAIAVQVRELQAERERGEVRYRFDLRFVVADTTRRAVYPSVDSMYVSGPSALDRRHLLHTYVELDVPPSEATVQRVVVTDATRPGVGQLYTTPFPVPDYSGDEMMLSDIAFGLPDPAAGWDRKGTTLALLPTSLFPESSFDVYYEIYNLPGGHDYETEVTIEREDRDDEGAVRARFAGEARAGPEGTVAEFRRVESALPRGKYRLTVTVRDLVTGAVAERGRSVEVRGWERGSTLVPALPRGTTARPSPVDEPSDDPISRRPAES